jgi:hypothetical protein
VNDPKFFKMREIFDLFRQNTIPYTGKSVQTDNNETEIGRKVVEALSERFYGTKRCIAMDNYFTSIPLAKTLFFNQLGLIGTMRANKNEVPPSFLPSKDNKLELLSSHFAFDKFLSFVSYVAKVISFNPINISHKKINFNFKSQIKVSYYCQMSTMVKKF